MHTQPASHGLVLACNDACTEVTQLLCRLLCTHAFLGASRPPAELRLLQVPPHGMPLLLTRCACALTPTPRAAKFGTDYRDPSKRRDLGLEAKKERLRRDGFITGIDFFSEVCGSTCDTGSGSREAGM